VTVEQRARQEWAPGGVVLRGEVVLRDAAYLAEWRSAQWRRVRAEQYEERYARWAYRQDLIRARDRKVRAFLLGFGVTFAVVMLALVGLAGYEVYRAVAHHGAAVVGGGVFLLILGALVASAGTCVTVVTITHHH